MVNDLIQYETRWKIKKYDEDIEAYDSKEEFLAENEPYEVSEIEGNVLLNEGIAVLQDLLVGNANTAYSNANTSLGVGTGTTAESSSDTGLVGETTTFATVDAGFPSISGQTTTWEATFGGTEANHAWEEFTVVNAADDTGDNLNRKTSSEGTKSSGQTWTLTIDITWS